MYSLLYIDDEPGLLDIGKIYLENTGDFSVTTAVSGPEGLEKLGRETFDAVVADYQMPEMDGIELLKKVRQSFGNIPFILFTGRGREEVVIEAINNGVDFYLQKGGDPTVQFAELAHKVRQAVSRRHAEIALSESEMRFRELADLLPQGIFESDTSGRFRYVNRMALEMSGYSDEDISKGLNAFDVIVPEDRQRAAAVFRQMVSLGTRPGGSAGYRGLRKDGSTFPVSIYSTPILKDGIVAGIRGLIVDTTEQKRAADEIRAVNEQLAASAEELRSQYDELASSESRIRMSEARLRYMLGFYENTQKSERELLEYAIEGAGIVTGSTLGYLAFLNEDESELSMYAWSKAAMAECSMREKPIIYRTEKTGLWGEAVRQRRPVVTNDYAAPNPAKKGYPAGHPHIIRHMNVPVIDEGHIVLVAGVANKPSDYTENDVSELLLLMQGLWTILKRKRLQEEQKASYEQLAAAGEELKAQYDELAKTEIRIREREQLLNDTFSSIRDGISILDKSMTVIRVNQTMEEWYSHELPLVGRKCWEVYHGRTGRCDICPSYQTLQTGRPARETVPMIDAGKQVGWLDLYSFPLIDSATGEMTGVIEYVRNITAEKESQDELRNAYEQLSATDEKLRQQFGELAGTRDELKQRQQQLEEIAATIPGVVYQFFARQDGSMGLYYVSSRAMEVFGLDNAPHDFFERFTRCVDPRDREGFLQSNAEVARSGRPWHYEGRFIKPSGEEIWFEGISRPIRRGTELVFNGVLLDITERKQAEEKVRMLTISVDRSADEVFWLDFDGKILYVNEAACRINGYTREEFGAMTIYDLSPDLTPEIWMGIIAGLRQQKTGLFAARHRRKNGEIADVEIMAVYVSQEGREYSFAFVRDITERKKEQEKVQESERNYRLLFETAAEGILIAQGDRMVNVNPAMVGLLGYPAAEITSRPFTDFIHPDDRELVMSRHLQRMRGEVPPTGYEFRIINGQGQIRWVLINSTKMMWSGEPASLSFLTDITEQKTAEDRLVAANEEYTNLLDQIQDIYYRSDTEGRLTKVSRSFAALLGYQDIGECLGQNIAEKFYLHPGDRKHLLEEIERLGKVTDYEILLKKRDGSPVLIATSSHPYTDSAGRILGIEGTFRDITERKRAEEALKESEEKYRNLAENTADILFSLDAGGLLTYVSPQISTLGYSPEDLTGTNFIHLIHPEDRGAVADRFKNEMISGDNVNSTFRLLDRSGTFRWMEERSNILFDDQHRPVGLHGVVRDITEEKAVRDALHESEEKYRTLVESSFDGIAIHQDGVVVYVNRTAARLLGSDDPEVFIGKTAVDLIAPAFRETIAERIRQSPREALELIREQFVRIDGTLIDVDVTTTPTIWKGRPAAYVTFRDITAQVRAEALYESLNLKDKEALRVAKMGHFEFDVASQTFLFNDQYYAMIGITPEEAGGYLMPAEVFAQRFVYPEDRHFVAETIGEAIETADPGFERQFESRIVRPDGTVMWVNVWFRIEKDAAGRTVRFYGVNQDISDRRRTEETLRESEEKYRMLVEQSRDGVFIIQDDRLVFFNKALAGVTGYTSEELEGKLLAELVAPEDREMVVSRARDRARGIAVPDLYEFGLLHKNNTDRTRVRVRAQIGIYRGRPASIGMFYDVTEERRREEALRESEEKYRTLVEMNRDIIYTVDAEGTILFVSPQAEIQLGYRRGDMEGKEFMEYVHPDDAETLLLHIREHNGSGSAIFQDQFRIRRKDGIYRWFEDKTIYTTDPQGKLIVAGTIRDITEEKAARDALRESEEKFRALVETTSDFIWEVDARGTYTYVSPQARAILGYAPEELLGKTPFDIMPPGEAERVATEFARCVAGRLPIVALENKAVKKDGTIVILETSGVVQTGTDGSYAGYRGIDRDITGRKRAEEAKRESEVRLSAILHGSPVLQFVIDSGHRVISWNRALEEYSGIRAADIVGTDQQWRAFYQEKRPVLADLLVDGDMARLSRLYAGKIRKSRYVEGAYEATDFFPQMGSAGIWLSFTAAILRDGQGTVTGAVETLEDITERVNAENALRESEERARTILNTAQAGIVLVDVKTHRIVDANRKALELIGLDRESVVGTVCHRFICPAEEGRCPVTDCRQTVDTSERILLTATGTRIPVLKTVVRVSLGGRDVLVESFVDISDRKRSEEAIQEANRKLNLLNSITRHDIRNQLMIAQGYTQLAMQGRPDPVVADFLKKITTAVQTIQRQIEFTKEYQELGVHAPAWFGIREIIGSVRPEKIAVRHTCPPEEIFADPMIDKVFFNLFDNAMKHGERVTTVTLGCEETDAGLIILFADNGAGVPEAEKKKIFEKGYGRNTGFGLFLAREILAITGITIREIGRPGEGAVFEITVPRGAYRLTG